MADVIPASVPASRGTDGRGLLIIELLCLLGALGLLLFGTNREAVGTLGVFFVSIVLEALPFVLLGALLGGVIEVFLPQEKVSALLPSRGLWTVLLAALMGIVFPVCECAVIPVIRRLIRKRVPLSAAVTYLLAGPIVNPIVGASTVVAYGGDFRIVAIRLGCGYVVAVTVGLLIGKIFNQDQALDSRVLAGASRNGEPLGDCCGCAPVGAGWALRLRAVLENAVHDFIDIGRFLVLGAFVAGLVQTFVSRSSLAVLSDMPGVSIGVMMVMALALNLCSEADAFVAASFRALFPLSAQMAFMVLGPMLDVKLLFMYLGVFRKRAIMLISALVVVCVFVLMLGVHQLAESIAL